MPSRKDRLYSVLERLSTLPRASSGLEFYAQLAELLNSAEDELWGPDNWQPPRSFLGGLRTQRLYPIQPESFHTVPSYPGVTMLLAKKELMFVSRFGAVEVQSKEPSDRWGQQRPFAGRRERVTYERPDAHGDGVWHIKNQR